jgi:hypothetical protein
MNALLVCLTLVVCGGVLVVAPGSASGALAFCLATSLPTIIILARQGTERSFLLRVFILGVLIRLIVGTVIFTGHWENFFGGDAITYDDYGGALAASWHGDKFQAGRCQAFLSSGASAWGMIYLVAGVYELIGRNLLAIQFINASIGAATAPVVYKIAQHAFNNKRVSRLAAVLVCFYPSLVLWSSQALKDGLIIFVLTLSILATLRLMEKVTARHIVVLTVSLLALLSLRFYVFYMMTAAVGGSLVIGLKSMDAQSFLKRFAAVVVIGIAFTWFGVLRSASSQFERFGSLAAVQTSRLDQARSAESGFGKDVDVQTAEGALTVIPMGLLYLLFAPFPWELASLRQILTLPEMLVWWASFPLLVLGLWFAFRHRLREVAPIVLFTSMLTLAYSVFQGNVGTAYRQRSQLLVFYFIFVAVGAVLIKERQEERQLQQQNAKRELAELQAARALARRQNTELRKSQSALRS